MRSAPSRGPRVADPGFLIDDGKVLLDDGEHVQSKPAVQGDLGLVQVREQGKQHRRDEGVRTQEQEGLAGVAAHGPFRTPACAPPSLVATAPPSLSGARRSPTSQMGGRHSGVSQHPRREARAGRGHGLSWKHPQSP